MLLMLLMLFIACALSQSSDSQDIGRYLGFRLRCLDVDVSASSSSDTSSRPTDTSHTAAAAAAVMTQQVRCDVTADSPYVCGCSLLQSPLARRVSRPAVDTEPASACSERRAAEQTLALDCQYSLVVYISRKFLNSNLTKFL